MHVKIALVALTPKQPLQVASAVVRALTYRPRENLPAHRAQLAKYVLRIQIEMN